MLKIVWFIPRAERDIEAAEALYQGQHVRRGMRQENLRAFRINRALYPQPEVIARLTGLGEPGAFRFSEGYWDSFEDIEECYRSPHGLAALADGMLNATARTPRGPQPVFFAEEQEFETAARLQFDIFRGGYSDPAPVKLFLFVRLKPGAASAFDAAYTALAGELAAVEGLGPHLLSRTLDHVLEIGLSSRWPPPGVAGYDRIGEYYFPDAAHLDNFLGSKHFGQVWELADRHAESVLPVAVEPQEVFFTKTGSQPISAGLQALYSDGA